MTIKELKKEIDNRLALGTITEDTEIEICMFSGYNNQRDCYSEMINIATDNADDVGIYVAGGQLHITVYDSKQ